MNEPSELTQHSDTTLHTDRLSWREFVIIPVLILLADITIYRNEGYAGLAAFLVFSSLLVLMGRYTSRVNQRTLFYYCLLLAIAYRMVCLGNVYQVFAGFFLQSLLYVHVAGGKSYVPEVLSYISGLFVSGLKRFAYYLSAVKFFKPQGFMIPLINYGFPLVVGLAFTTIFILANPDVINLVTRNAEYLIKQLQGFLNNFQLAEIIFWGVMFLLFAGVMNHAILTESTQLEANQSIQPVLKPGTSEDTPSSIYPAYRNTLYLVIALFAGYLVFEFQTLWLRQFPKGFYYAGYAHEGAFWLTVALGMATALLSFIFNRQTLRDHRVVYLKKLALIWSVLNIMLAIAVYNRLHIYIDYNGMTRMRIVGILGTTAVLVGFLLVVYKLYLNKTFAWLIQRQLWVPLIMFYIYAVLPIDQLVFKYNTARILEGQLAPSVQISVQPIDGEGIVELLPLLELEQNIIIKQGVDSMVQSYFKELNNVPNENRSWQGFQWSEQYAHKNIEYYIKNQKSGPEQTPVSNEIQEQRLKEFREYVYQWY